MSDRVPDLSKLSLDDLIQMRIMIMSLCEAGRCLSLECDGVTFDLTPGRAARIVTPFQMPDLGGKARTYEDLVADAGRYRGPFSRHDFSSRHLHLGPEPVFFGFDKGKPLDKNSPPAVPDADGAAVEPAPAVVAPTAGADDEIDEALVTELAHEMAAACAACETDVSDLDPVAPPPAAVVEPSPAARATVAGDVDPAKPAPWTAEEDDRLVQLVAEAMADGEKLNRAAAAAANVLGRPEEGTKYRVYNKVKDRVYDALAQLKKPAAEQTPPEPARQLAGADAVDRAGGASQPAPGAPKAEPKPAPKPAPKPPAPTPPADLPPELASAAAHLRSVTPFGKWTPTMDRDLLRELVELRWPLHEVCLDLGVSTIQAHQRLHTLTKGKALKNAEIWAAMQALGYGLSDEVA